MPRTQPSSKEDLKGQPSENSRIATEVLVIIFWAALLYVIRDIISPVLLCFALLISLFWIRKNLPSTILMIVLVVVFALWWLMTEIGSFLIPFVISFVLAYLLNPLVEQMEKKMPRGTAIGLIAFLTLAIIVLLTILIIPPASAQIIELIRKIPEYFEKVKIWLGYDLPNFLARFRIAYNMNELGKDITEKLTAQSEEILKNALTSVIGLLAGASFVFAQIMNLILIPFLTYYFLKDYKVLRRKISSLLPKKHAPNIRDFIEESNLILAKYIRGQLLVCLVIGILTSLGLWIAGIDYFFLLGAITGVLNLIPRIGLIFSIIPAVVVGLLSPEPLHAIVKIGLVFLVVQGGESIVSPKIVGKYVGLHPIWTVFALFFFAHFWGLVGLLIAVPVASIVKIIVSDIVDSYLKSGYYLGTQDREDNTEELG